MTQTPDRNQLAKEWVEKQRLQFADRLLYPDTNKVLDTIEAALTAQTVTESEIEVAASTCRNFIDPDKHLDVARALQTLIRAATAPKCDALVKALEEIKKTCALVGKHSFHKGSVLDDIETACDKALAAHKAQGGV